MRPPTSLASKRGAIAPPWRDGEVRPDYAAGLWRYAVGAPAVEHPEYDAAVKIAERDGWSPWWIRSRVDVRAVLDGCWFDHEAAMRPVDFFRKFLKVPRGRLAGKPFVLMDWQQYDLIMPVFGWKRPDGTRRFRKAAAWAPKKNGKSALCAGVGLYLTIADREQGAEVYAVSTTVDQIDRTIHAPARSMVRKSPALRGRMTVLDSAYKISHAASGSVFMALSSEDRGAEGLDFHGLLPDELHVIERRLLEALEEGGIARRQPLMLAISTAGLYDPTAIGFEWWELTNRVRDGALEDWSFYPLAYYATQDDDPADPAVWKRSNPSMGVTITEDGMRETWKKVEDQPGGLSKFLRYRLNIWVQHTEKWIDAQVWAAAAQPVRAPAIVTRDRVALPDYAEALRRRPCWGGMDLSSVQDMTATALYFPRHEGAPAAALVWCWLPGENLTRLALQARAPYAIWKRDGWLSTTEGITTDTDAVREFWSLASNLFDIRDIGFDPWNAGTLVNQLESDGFTMVKVPQGFRGLNNAIKHLEIEIGRGEFLHPDHPILNWNVSNAMVRHDNGGNKRIDKGNAREKKRVHTDGLMALLTAIARAIESPVEETRYSLTLI